MAGDGKTHYIKRKLNFCSACCSISVNESFTPIGAIKKLRQLPTNQPNCAVFFNFTLLPRGKLSCPQHNTSKVSHNAFVTNLLKIMRFL